MRRKGQLVVGSKSVTYCPICGNRWNRTNKIESRLVLISRYKYSSPFKGEARRGMGCFDTEKPIPTPPLPLKGREFLMAAEDW